jgi:hypothetical protein
MMVTESGTDGKLRLPAVGTTDLMQRADPIMVPSGVHAKLGYLANGAFIRTVWTAG